MGDPCRGTFFNGLFDRSRVNLVKVSCYIFVQELEPLDLPKRNRFALCVLEEFQEEATIQIFFSDEAYLLLAQWVYKQTNLPHLERRAT